MKLIQAKLRGTGPLLESNWFELSAGLNQFHFLDQRRGTAFLRALQTLHPLVSCKKTETFKELPLFEKRGVHTRHIQPAKRTIALGVFGATANLVKELGLLDQNLYETDRIEIGRRLDYSRWLNFVELSSSTRWKEIEEGVQELLQPLRQKSDRYNKLFNQIDGLKGSERIKDELTRDLLLLLDLSKESQKSTILFEEVVTLIKRAAHFQSARKVVLRRLPFLIYFNSAGEIAPPVSMDQHPLSHSHQELFQLIEAAKLAPSFSEQRTNLQNLSVLERLQSGIHLSLAVSKELQRISPIFMFDSPEQNITKTEHQQLRHLLHDTSQSHQCLYLSSTENFLEQSNTGKSYKCSQLKISRD